MRDAARIAGCTLKDLIRGSFVPEALVQRRCQHNRRIFDQNKEKVYEHTRPEALLQRCNILISNCHSSADSRSCKEEARLLSEGVASPGRPM